MSRNAKTAMSVDEDNGIVVRKSERAYSWLRDEILSFRMQPGMFIDKVEVCEKLGVSKQPVTAALTRLRQEGLVEIYPQRGSYVARLQARRHDGEPVRPRRAGSRDRSTAVLGGQRSSRSRTAPQPGGAGGRSGGGPSGALFGPRPGVPRDPRACGPLRTGGASDRHRAGHGEALLRDPASGRRVDHGIDRRTSAHRRGDRGPRR